VAMAVGSIVAHEGRGDLPASEDDLFARERDAFIRLARTAETEARIVAMLETGTMLRN